jgi:hypothetical protein
MYQIENGGWLRERSECSETLTIIEPPQRTVSFLPEKSFKTSNISPPHILQFVLLLEIFMFSILTLPRR